MTKPVVGYVAGFTAPEGKTMGHAGAIVSGSSGTAQAKKEALEAAGVRVGKTPSETARADARDRGSLRASSSGTPRRVGIRSPRARAFVSRARGGGATGGRVGNVARPS